MHTVTADQMQIRESKLEFLANGSYMTGVIVIIDRIGFLLPNHAAIEDVSFTRESDFCQLPLRQFNQILVERIPQTVMFETKIFQTVASFVRLRHHFRRPGPKVLNPADFHAWVVNINPIVVESVAIFQNKHDRKKIAIFE